MMARTDHGQTAPTPASPHLASLAIVRIKPCPHITAATAKTDSKTDTGHQACNTPARHKNLKSVVLGHKGTMTGGPSRR
jgi:hypothetical protein